jgi:hypothetical protein
MRIHAVEISKTATLVPRSEVKLDVQNILYKYCFIQFYRYELLGSQINHHDVTFFNEFNCKKRTLNIPNTIVCDPPTASDIQFF